MPQKALEIAKNAVEDKKFEMNSPIVTLALQCLYKENGDIALDLIIPNTQTRLLNFGSGCSDISSAAETICNYLSKAKFLFFINEELYAEFLAQLKYYTMCILEADNRQDFLQLLVSEQAMRN